jgi:hypothetical protein
MVSAIPYGGAPTQSVTARASNQASAQGGNASAHTAPIFIPYPQQQQGMVSRNYQNGAQQPQESSRPPNLFSQNTGYGTYTFPQGQPGNGSYGTNSGEVGVSFIPGRGVTGYSVPSGGITYGFQPGQAAGTGSYSTPTNFNSSYGYVPGVTGAGEGQFTYGVHGMGDTYQGTPEPIPYIPSVWNPTPSATTPTPPSMQVKNYNPSPSKPTEREPELDVRGRLINPNLKEQFPSGGAFGGGMDAPDADPTAGRMYRPDDGFQQQPTYQGDVSQEAQPRSPFEQAIHALGDGEPVPSEAIPAAVEQMQDTGIVPPGVMRQADWDALGMYLAGISTKQGLAAARTFAQYLLGLPAGAFMGHP